MLLSETLLHERSCILEICSAFCLSLVILRRSSSNRVTSIQDTLGSLFVAELSKSDQRVINMTGAYHALCHTLQRFAGHMLTELFWPVRYCRSCYV